ncbi:thiamine biosynthesis lipoprotein [Thermocatellispora tengchongensis]|uniref:FAD:protein FMN transferase n=1 Tax=Thermocatellispora tengchongensis TaxID=1073253 RepID=A0A840P870_9ACTN|nr:FAD:protein FMN transferase [Thermocatellispora tengchongensis]MBB5134061.1 thiamine biosynthesis lipoprotein [Thermocatellispora tengchongensis]
MRALRGRVMGTELLLAGLGPGEQAAVLGRLREVERVFSRFRPGSDVSRANASAGAWVEVSEPFLAVLEEACGHYARTGGLFCPFLGAELARLGYDTDFGVVAARGPVREEPPPPVPERPVIEVDRERRRVRLPPGLAVDLGGFVKGWGVQRAAEALRSDGVARGLIDAGGDLVAWRAPGDPPWRIGVEHPLRPEPVGVLEPAAGLVAVATSSTVRRSWAAEGGGRLHHILDPRTGRPARSGCVQATVVGADLAAAEVHATCLVILGMEEGPAWLARADPSAAWICVGAEGEMRASEGAALREARTSKGRAS